MIFFTIFLQTITFGLCKKLFLFDKRIRKMSQTRQIIKRKRETYLNSLVLKNIFLLGRLSVLWIVYYTMCKKRELNWI